MRRWLSELWHHHKMEVILGLVFAVLFGVAWEIGKHTWLHAVHVEPERLVAGTVRVITAIKMENAAQRAAVESWQKDHPNVLIVGDVALLRMGSGFVATDDGWIVTARHVVSRPLPQVLTATGAIPYFIVVYPKDEERLAAVVEADERFDTALLRTYEPPQARYLVIGNPEDVRQLDRVTVSGYPTAADYSSPFDPTVTEGEISKVGKDSPYGTVFHITAPVSAGNSGGPLIDRHGKIIGIALGTTVEDRAIAIAVSIERAAKMLARRHVVLPVLYERQEVARRWLFVAIAATAVLLFLGFFGVALRSFWRRRFKAEADPPYAGFWIRAVALLVDVFVVLTVWLFFVVLLALATKRFAASYAVMIGVVPAWCVYAAVCVKRWGATIGKRVAGVLVRREDDGSLSLSQAFVRVAAHVLSALPLGVGFIAAAFDPRRRAFHDRIANTVVVEQRKRSPWMMLATGSAVLVLSLLAVLLQWTILEDRAKEDLRRAHERFWPEAGAPEHADALIAQEKDRIAFLRWIPVTRRPPLLYEHGLDLMRAGSAREAIETFKAAAGGSWDAVLGPFRVHGAIDPDAVAAKTGWCYLELGADREATQMFEHALNFEGFLGKATTARRRGDVKTMRESCARAARIQPRGSETLARMTGHAPAPYHFTPAQLRAVQETLSACR